MILASQSPRRHSLLRDVGIPFTVVTSDAEELVAGGSASQLAEANALGKVQGARVPAGPEPGSFVLGTDTLVTIDGVVMGKPASAAEATAMLGLLAGRTHQVVSGVALQRIGSAGPAATADRVEVASAVTDVTFLCLDSGQVESYIASGEWKGKAGGYAVQGLAGLFVSEVKGEYSNVVGLPLCLLARSFRRLGFDLVQRTWLEGGL
ncbi:MAG: septum formation protein Maf [Thermoleophilia bacterium]|nr:septum formation protein Maf [Thermoleophilia bacterium]